MVLSAGSCSFLAVLFLVFAHASCIHSDMGNFVYFAKYSFSMAVVSCVSLKVLDLWLLYPLAFSMPLSKSTSLYSTWLSS